MPSPETQASPFAGEYRHALDSKHRITVPSPWRDGRDGRLYLIPDQTNSFLLAMPPEEFRAVRERVTGNAETPPREQRIFLRQFYSRARAATIDRQGRLLLPEEQCRQVGLENEVMLVGSDERIEIWDPEKWAQFKSAHDDLYRRVADSVGL